MPLNRPLLPLEAKPSTVHFARSWVDEVCQNIDRHDLIGCAQLAVSELVTNALLHGQPQFGIRLRGTKAHPRVEVIDGSQRPPVLPGAADPEDLLNTFGRGLSIVAACAIAWGAVIEPTGKFVWFEPSDELLEEPTPGRITDLRLDEEAPVAEGVPVTLLGVPTAAALGMRRRYYDLRRELRLLELSHDGEYPVAHEFVDKFVDYEHHLPTLFGAAIQQAREEDRDTFDVEVTVRPEAAHIFGQMNAIFDRADEFCRTEQLLALERTDEEREFQHWFLDELTAQLAGGKPKRFFQRQSV